MLTKPIYKNTVDATLHSTFELLPFLGKSNTDSLGCSGSGLTNFNIANYDNYDSEYNDNHGENALKFFLSQNLATNSLNE